MVSKETQIYNRIESNIQISWPKKACWTKDELYCKNICSLNAISSTWKRICHLLSPSSAYRNRVIRNSVRKNISPKLSQPMCFLTWSLLHSNCGISRTGEATTCFLLRTSRSFGKWNGADTVQAIFPKPNKRWNDELMPFVALDRFVWTKSDAVTLAGVNRAESSDLFWEWGQLGSFEKH